MCPCTFHFTFVCTQISPMYAENIIIDLSTRKQLNILNKKMNANSARDQLCLELDSARFEGEAGGALLLFLLVCVGDLAGTSG